MKARPAIALLFLIIILSSVLLGCFLKAHSSRGDDSFFCTTNLNIHSDSDMMRVSMNFNLEHGDGFVTMNGLVVKGTGETLPVSIKKGFVYTQHDGEFFFYQKKDGVLELNGTRPDMLEKFIPDFYLKRNTGVHHVRIKKITPDTWIFTTLPTPYFLCSDN